VRRQIEWLTASGWAVDTVGLGEYPVPGVTEHFPLREGRAWTKTPVGTLVLYLLTPRVRRFRRLITDGIDRRLHERIAAGGYALIVFNDTHLLPWVKDPKVFTRRAASAHLHADIHEYFAPRYPRTSLWARVTGPHHDWVRSLIGDPSFDTRSVVVDEIAALYESEFDIARPTVIMNAPAALELSPSPTHQPIRLVYHGKSELTRGLGEIVDAIGLLNDDYHLTMYLVGGPEVASALAERSRPFAQRVTIEPPVPYEEICPTINQHDLEIVFFPPATRNHEVALPNKLFEAVQARLGLVIGPTPPMRRIVERYKIGVVSEGWQASDLARAIERVSVADIERWKKTSESAANELNSTHEGRRFIDLVGSAGIAK
jgi:hypothetical protein